MAFSSDEYNVIVTSHVRPVSELVKLPGRLASGTEWRSEAIALQKVVVCADAYAGRVCAGSTVASVQAS
jgi:hypothetical protein